MSRERCKFYAPDGASGETAKAADFLNWVLQSLSDDEYQEMVGSCSQGLQTEVVKGLSLRLLTEGVDE